MSLLTAIYPDVIWMTPPQEASSLCSTAFGPDFAIPQKPTDGSDPRYVFNCDPDGDNGLIPATINTIGATECTCPAGQTLQNDVCVCPVGQARQDGVCAACPAGQIALNGACAVCADGEIAYRGVCTDASVLELSGKALTLYNLLAARITDLDDGSFRPIQCSQRVSTGHFRPTQRRCELHRQP